jgi:hypothetical protein
MANNQTTSSSQPLTTAQRAALIARMKTAWANLPPGTQAQIKPRLEDAHLQLGKFLGVGTAIDHSVHQILALKSFLTDDWDGHLKSLAVASPAGALQITVGPGGEILGAGKYQELDPLWTLLTGTVWLENLLHRHPFPPGTPTPIPIPNQVKIALIGDFGTGNFGADDSPSTKISKFVPTLNPDFTIHLGDVYYAGTSDEESSNLVNFWPKGSLGSFALNSNHEMYSGGWPYFDEAVGGPIFNTLQSPWSFFALENDNWIIVGLDSAYYADALALYMDGSLGNSAQLPFLQGLANKGKKVIVMTHHNGLPENGIQSSPPLKLFTEMMGAFNGAPAPAYWYFGHVHAGVVYKPLPAYNGLLCRCVGHSAIPWGLASDLQGSAAVQWFENRNANDPADPLRVYNGFALLQLDGPNIAETFYDENGGIAWP